MGDGRCVARGARVVGAMHMGGGGGSSRQNFALSRQDFALSRQNFEFSRPRRQTDATINPPQTKPQTASTMTRSSCSRRGGSDATEGSDPTTIHNGSTDDELGH